MAMQQNTSIDSDQVQIQMLTEPISRESASLAHQTGRSRKTADGHVAAAQGGHRPTLRLITRWAWYSTRGPLACRWDVPLFFS